jgi:hypothetical protein
MDRGGKVVEGNAFVVRKDTLLERRWHLQGVLPSLAQN